VAGAGGAAGEAAASGCFGFVKMVNGFCSAARKAALADFFSGSGVVAGAGGAGGAAVATVPAAGAAGGAFSQAALPGADVDGSIG
jgi:hypothetical protein